MRSGAGQQLERIKTAITFWKIVQDLKGTKM